MMTIGNFQRWRSCHVFPDCFAPDVNFGHTDKAQSSNIRFFASDAAAFPWSKERDGPTVEGAPAQREQLVRFFSANAPAIEHLLPHPLARVTNDQLSTE
jgi:hypothetical protein